MLRMADTERPEQPKNRSLGEWSRSPAILRLREAFRTIRAETTANLDAIDGLESEIITIACPFQVEGTVDGVPLYFRERWEAWQIGIGDGDPVDIAFGRAPGFRMEGCLREEDPDPYHLYAVIIRGRIEA